MRRRAIRLCDVATSLFYYLMLIDIAGVHAYAAISKQPQYKLPLLEQVVRQAQAQVKAYEARIPESGPAKPEELAERLDDKAKALLRQLDTVDEALAGEKTDAARWDQAIKVAEDVRQLGEKLAEAKDATEQKVGLALALRGARTQARVGQLIAGLSNVAPWGSVVTTGSRRSRAPAADGH